MEKELKLYKEKIRKQNYAFIAGIVLAIGMAVFLILEINIITYGRTDHEQSVSAVIVLGAGVHGTRPSLTLEKRLEATLEYIEDKEDIPIVVSGGQGAGEEITEARWCSPDEALTLIRKGTTAEYFLINAVKELKRKI